jgi:hypothetical protein
VRIRTACFLGLLDTEDERNTFFETSIIMYQLAYSDVPSDFNLYTRNILT